VQFEFQALSLLSDQQWNLSSESESKFEGQTIKNNRDAKLQSNY
jgi:hypothetical protein